MSGRIVGVHPWLPWPLSGWRWWTVPVRAERLAVLRLAVGLLLFVDILYSYLPHVRDFFGPDSLGTPEMFAYLARAPKWNWSLLRGFQDPLLTSLAQAAWFVSTVVVLLGLWGRLTAEGGGQHVGLRRALAVWLAATAFTVFGLWTRVNAASEHGASLVWRAPMVALGLAMVFWCLALWRRFRSEADDDPWVWRWVLLAWAGAAALAGVGVWKWLAGGDHPGTPGFLAWTGARWHGEAAVLLAAMIAWVAAAFLLTVGCWTRVATIAAWALSVSFDNLNWYVNNAGDQVRTIALFSLMLCPCGAAWSLDSWYARRRGRPNGPVYVYPWPLRLLFLQMVCIYFCNGVYKVMGADWMAGASLYHVWCDLALTRFSYAQMPIPYALTRVASWTVFAWELSFPVLVLVKWTRVPALLFGVTFHLGIFATMELGGFGPYMIALYLPLLPWDRWLKARDEAAVGQGPSAAGAASGGQEPESSRIRPVDVR